MAFGWDISESEQSDTHEFEQAGFTMNSSVVLTTAFVLKPKHLNLNIQVRALEQDWEWQSALENQVLAGAQRTEDWEFKEFKKKQMECYRRMSEQGLGNWYGAFIRNRLVGDMGLYFSDQIGRFQSVVTHPLFRRQGVCSTLVYRVSIEALRNNKAKQLVIVADESYHAGRIYESLGFIQSEYQRGMHHPRLRI
jgi:N-acetylglutamate synthase-like GNAT family acetyltransferase